MARDTHLTAYWIRFSGLPELQHSYGVTAYTIEDALWLLRNRLLDRDLGTPIEVKRDVRLTDLDQGHVAPNCGPLVLRGVWYPQHNLGDEAP
jgi:hypothetical protein